MSQESVLLKARWGHSLTPVSLGLALTEVVEFGGSPDPWKTNDYVLQPKIADTALLQFSELGCIDTSREILVECVHKSHMSGTS